MRERNFRDPFKTHRLDVIASTLCSNLAGLLPSQWDRGLPPVPGFHESFPGQQQEQSLQQQHQLQPVQWQPHCAVPEQPRDSATLVWAISVKATTPRAALQLAQDAGLCIACGMWGADTNVRCREAQTKSSTQGRGPPSSTGVGASRSSTKQPKCDTGECCSSAETLSLSSWITAYADMIAFLRLTCKSSVQMLSGQSDLWRS